MPYVYREVRNELDAVLDTLIALIPEALGKEVSDGTVNYVITRIIDAAYGMGGYGKFNRAMGVLDCVSKEFYRRKVAPYEDIKLKENGDAYNVYN
jgi:hypothetical protein